MVEKQTKSVFLNGQLVGEVPVTGDYKSDAAAAAALIKAKGLEPKQQSKERAMFLQAYAFASAAGVLYDRYIKNGVTAESQIGASPFIVNSALAIELYLKTLGKAHGASLHGHSLIELYASLPNNARAAIEAERQKLAGKHKVTATASEILTELKNCFVDWRYIYEKEWSGVVQIPNLIFVLVVLHEAVRATGKADFNQ